MIKVYFTAATSGNGDLEGNYRRIVSWLKKKNLLLISGGQIISEKLLAHDKKLSKEQIFQRERKRIDEADLVIAEVTKPSTGVGGEIVYALVNHRPVLALVFRENQDMLSPMIEGNPSDNLFLEHYDFDNLHLIIGKFLRHVRQLKNRKGRLIVIDGADGAGKATQAELLIHDLQKHKIPTKYFDFPRYYTSFHGRIIAQFLRGEYGPLDQISPYLISLAYALDRASVKEEMDEFLQKGGVIVANRYATSTMAHQTARLKSRKQRTEFLKWVNELEYKIHKIPREDLVIYLYVPWAVSMKLTDKKTKRSYLEGRKTDIAESHTAHRIESEKMYLALAEKYHHWVRMDCMKDGNLLSRENIHQKIVRILHDRGVYP